VSWKDLPSGAEALICFVIFTARLKPCPFKMDLCYRLLRVTTLSGSMLHIYNGMAGGEVLRRTTIFGEHNDPC
jgi:hypothetical protein